MQFTTFTFLLFAAIVLALYYLMPGRFQWMLLLVASYCFYIYAGVEYLFFILFTTASTYGATMIMAKNLEKQDAYLAAHKAETQKNSQELVSSFIRTLSILSVPVVVSS